MFKNLSVSVAQTAHPGCSYLAQAYAMPPTGTMQGECHDISVGIMFTFHFKGTAQKVSV